ncbi:MAG: type IV secretion system protein VirB10 [Burkholderiales bacterium]|nr:type IV secretion system protein VirB10 [Burkholderiales bacterium]
MSSAFGTTPSTSTACRPAKARPGEPGVPDVAAEQRVSISRKGLAAVVLLVGSLVAVSAFGIHRFAASGKPKADAQPVRAGDKPAAASTDPRKLDMQPMPASGVAAGGGTLAPRIPALARDETDDAEPIGVRRTGAGSAGTSGAKWVAPEDAPILLVTSRPGPISSAEGAGRRTGGSDHAATGAAGTSDETLDPLRATTRNLEGYQRQLQGLLDNLAKTADVAGAGSIGNNSAAVMLNAPPAAGVIHASIGGSGGSGTGLFGGRLQGSATSTVMAGRLVNRSLILPKGTAFTCALKTKLISAASGLVGCQVQRNVFSDDGRVLLIERGSHLDGEYRIASVRPGTVRIPVLWTRIRTPLGVTVDIDSPATGALGEAGIDGYVDNRWTERIGAAMLLSLIDDSVKLVIQNQANERQADTIVLPSTTANTSKLAEKVLDSTINIPPLVYQNQGGVVGIYVARDVDFSSVYELRPTSR